ncbi:hypothetical protein H5T51_02035 [Candidatus Bathyarchaeota archaeon]|nr:hypothetical protein [Candidatus Bathyarchaeota archaeon]
MISSVTTVATVFGATISIVAVIFLISLLATKEILTTDTKHILRTLGKNLDVAIWPLLLAFTLIVAIKILEILA